MSGGLQEPASLDAVPDKPGVYMLIAADEIVYIGASGSVQSRLRGHAVERRYPFDAVRITTFDTHTDALVHEEDMLLQHRPKWNRLGVEPQNWKARPKEPPEVFERRQMRALARLAAATTTETVVIESLDHGSVAAERRLAYEALQALVLAVKETRRGGLDEARVAATVAVVKLADALRLQAEVQP